MFKPTENEINGKLTRLWIGTQPNPNDRRQILIPAHCELPTDDMPLVVKDYITGEIVAIRRADCGLGCKCALEFVEKLS